MNFLGYSIVKTSAPLCMRKEVIIAIVLGFALGLVITFGIWKANKALKKEVPEEVPVVEEVTLEPTPTPAFDLQIISPADQSISEEAKITITGKTQPGSVIAVAYEKGEDIVEADSAGNFEVEVGLVSGINEIEITAFSLEGDEASKSLNIVYSTAEI